MDSNLRDVAETASDAASAPAPTPTPEAHRTLPTGQQEEEPSAPTPTNSATASDAVSGTEEASRTEAASEDVSGADTGSGPEPVAESDAGTEPEAEDTSESDGASESEDVSEDVSVSGTEEASPSDGDDESEDATESEPDAESMPAPVPAPRVRVPSLAPELIVRLDKTPDLATAETNLARLSEAYHRGDNRAIADALIEQAHVLQVFGIKVLIVASGEKYVRSIETYTALGLRALEQARKTLLALHGLSDPKPRRQTNVQVNVAGPANEVLEVSHEE